MLDEEAFQRASFEEKKYGRNSPISIINVIDGVAIRVVLSNAFVSVVISLSGQKQKLGGGCHGKLRNCFCLLPVQRAVGGIAEGE